SIKVITDLAMPCSNRNSSATGKITSTMALPTPATSKRSFIFPSVASLTFAHYKRPHDELRLRHPIGKSKGRRTGYPALSAHELCNIKSPGTPCGRVDDDDFRTLRGANGAGYDRSAHDTSADVRT